MKALPLALLFTTFVPAALPPCACGQASQSEQAASANTSRTEAVQTAGAAGAAFREGYAAAQRNDLAAARLNFQKAVRLAPQIGAGHAALGSVLLALGDLLGAIHELEAALRLDHSDKSTLVNLCVAYSRNHDYAKSIASYRELTPASDLPADAATGVAAAFSATGDIHSAQEVVQRAIEADPDNALLQDALGTLLAQQKDYTSAEVRFRRAIALDQTLAAAHYHLGSVESATNRAPEALAELSQAHTFDPENVLYAVDLARALLLDHQEAAAIELLRATLARAGKQQGAEAGAEQIEVKYRLALALQSADNVKEAMPLLTEVITARPDDAEALTNAALAHVQLGDAKGGIPLYLRALKLTPTNPTLREDLGVAYLQQADLDHALEQFRAGLAVDDQSPQLHYDLALALKLKDDLAGAVPEFERAAALDPQLPDPPFTLGIIYMQQGKFEKAAASFETALALRPDNGEAWATLGSVYQQMQEPDKAVPALRKAIELMPQQPSPHITLAAILAAQGHRDEAAAERKIGAALTRAATNRQKANFGLESGNLLMKRGQTADALVQFEDAVEADPNYAAPHLALAEALDRAGRKAEAAEERRKAEALEAGTSKP